MRAARMHSAGFFGSKDSLRSPAPTLRIATVPIPFIRCYSSNLTDTMPICHAQFHHATPDHTSP